VILIFLTRSRFAPDIVSKGEKPTLHVWTAYIDALILSARYKAARKAIDRLRASGEILDARVYHVIIRFFVAIGHSTSIPVVLAEMEERGVEPDRKIYCLLLNLARHWEGDAPFLLKQKMAAAGIVPEPDDFMHALHNEPTAENVRALLAEMSSFDPPVVPSGACLRKMILILSEQGNHQEAIELAADAQSRGATPDEFLLDALVCSLHIPKYLIFRFISLIPLFSQGSPVDVATGKVSFKFSKH
jgi:hypothetical protein